MWEMSGLVSLPYSLVSTGSLILKECAWAASGGSYIFHVSLTRYPGSHMNYLTQSSTTAVRLVFPTLI